MCELSYYIFFTAVPCYSGMHPALRRVGLHAHSNEAIFPRDCTPEIWQHLEDHFAAYRPEAFPSLIEFVLYGTEWRQLTRSPCFQAINERLESDGKHLIVDDSVSDVVSSLV